MSPQNTSSSTTQTAKTQSKNTKITRRTLLISAGALGITGAGTLWWTNTPHYPNEQHQHIADTIKNITDIGDDNNQTHPVKVNITTGLNLPAPDTHQPAPNEPTLQTDGITAQKHASTLSAPTVGLNITYTETGLTQTPEYSRPQMILPPSHQAALANFSASLEDPEGPSVIAGHVNYDNNTMAPMSLCIHYSWRNHQLACSQPPLLCLSRPTRRHLRVPRPQTPAPHYLRRDRWARALHHQHRHHLHTSVNK